MRRAFLVLALLAVAAATHAYTTPGTGVRWTCADLVANSGGAVTGSGNDFDVHESVVVALGDTLDVTHFSTLTFQDTSGLVELDIHGALMAFQATFTSAGAQPGDWYGIRFRDTGPGSLLQMERCTIEYGRYGVDVVYADIDLLRVTVQHTLEKAIDLTGAGGTIRECFLYDNRRQTIYMTLSSSPLIESCQLRRNNLDNSSPYPYINIGLQGVNSPTIRGNTIRGGQHMSGGIAIWNSSEALIESNSIKDCGYGILCYSVAANPTIKGNSILDNNIHPDQVNWGFGIACNGDNQPVIQGNLITGHWYGIAITGGAQPDLGHDNAGPGQSQGGNMLFFNGLGVETYAIFNNTSNAISAEGNWYGEEVWTLGDVENVIWHGVDDLALGMVDFDPSFFGSIELGAGDVARPLELHGVAPNPFNPRTEVRFTLGKASDVILEIHDARGRRVRTIRAGVLTAGRHELLFDGTGSRGEALPSGVYLYRLIAGGTQVTGSMQLVR